MDVGVNVRILTDLRVYHDDPAKVKCLLLPTKLIGRRTGKKATKADESSPILMNGQMEDQVWQQVLIQGQRGSLEAAIGKLLQQLRTKF